MRTEEPTSTNTEKIPISRSGTAVSLLAMNPDVFRGAGISNLPGSTESVWLVCCWQVNQENVVKVGHRQVVNMIRQGGNRLLIKVVTVSRNLDPDDTARKKGTAAILNPSLGLSLHLHIHSAHPDL